MEQRKIKLAMVQFDSVPLGIKRNIERMCEFASQAKQQEARIVVFPELCTCGYFLNEIRNAPEQAALDPEGEKMRLLCDAAKENQICIVAGAMIKRKNGYSNSAVLIGEDGKILHIHDKVYLWGEEKELFLAGMDFSVIPLSFGNLGIMICYDSGFPENSRRMGMKNAELILAPSSFSQSQRLRWNIYFSARALENTCYVAGINGTGGNTEDPFFGNNVLFAPNGENVIWGTDNTEEMQIAEIDLSLADWEHKMNSFIGELSEKENI